MAQVVPIEKVIPLGSSSRYSVRKMASVLQKQGQIEPLQVIPFEDKYLIFTEDAHAYEIVHAARALGWPTLLIVEMARYEQ